MSSPVTNATSSGKRRGGVELSRRCSVCGRDVHRGGGRRAALTAQHWIHTEGGRPRCVGSDVPWAEQVRVEANVVHRDAKPGNLIRVDFAGARIARLERGGLSRADARAFVLPAGGA